MICPHCDLAEVRNGSCGWCERRIEEPRRLPTALIGTPAQCLKAAKLLGLEINLAPTGTPAHTGGGEG